MRTLVSCPLSVVTLTTILSAASIAHAQPSSDQEPGKILVRNTCSEPMWIWFWPEIGNDWVRPELHIPKLAVRRVGLATPGLCYVVLRDKGRNDTHVGWLDLHGISQESVDGIVSLGKVVETRQATRTIVKHVPRQVTKIVGGRKVTYTVYEAVSEEVPYEYQIEVPILTIRLADGSTDTLRGPRKRSEMAPNLGEMAPAPPAE